MCLGLSYVGLGLSIGKSLFFAIINLFGIKTLRKTEKLVVMCLVK